MMATWRKRKYVRMVERVLGRSLPIGAVVHHVDGNRQNNAHDNLCVLQNQTEHKVLHRRLRIKRAGGNPWTQQICATCRQVKDVLDFCPSRQTNSGECHACAAYRQSPVKMTPAERSALGREMAYRRWRKHREVSYASV